MGWNYIKILTVSVPLWHLAYFTKCLILPILKEFSKGGIELIEPFSNDSLLSKNFSLKDIIMMARPHNLMLTGRKDYENFLLITTGININNQKISPLFELLTRKSLLWAIFCTICQYWVFTFFRTNEHSNKLLQSQERWRDSSR